MTKQIVHVMNVDWIGGVTSFVVDLAHSFPEFAHQAVCLNEAKSHAANANWMRESGVPVCYATRVDAGLLETVKADILILHNTPDARCAKPYSFLEHQATIAFHHAWSPLMPFVDYDLFPSNYTRVRYIPYREGIQNEAVVHPGCWAPPFLALSAPAGEPATIGRMQSSYLGDKGKFKTCRELAIALAPLPCHFVGPTAEQVDTQGLPNVAILPCEPGLAPRFLERIDIVALDIPTRETWSRAATEAMLAGRPVVAMNYADGLAEQLTLAGAPLVNCVGDLVAAVKYLAGDTHARVALGRRLQGWALLNAGEAHLRDRLTPIFMDLLARY